MQFISLAILGSTGSIGQQTLDIVRENREVLKVSSLVAQSNYQLLLEQVREFQPKIAVLTSAEAYEKALPQMPSHTKLYCAEEGILRAIELEEVHTVVAAISGFAGLKSVISAIELGKHIALANKEAFIAGGEVIKSKLLHSPTKLIPVDSEHSSIYQCLMGKREGDLLNKIILTASGGPFLNKDLKSFSEITPQMALKHPKWSMGDKISIDSATLMNKGLEVIEAAYLFDLLAEKIEVLIHPQSIIHGMISYDDGSQVAVMFETDMRVPISFALSQLLSEKLDQDIFGSRSLSSGVKQLNLLEHNKLEFFKVEQAKFPALNLAYQALKNGQAYTICLNAANEIAVAAFLRQQITFPNITVVVEESLNIYNDSINISSIEDIMEIDASSREIASNSVDKHRMVR